MEKLSYLMRCAVMACLVGFVGSATAIDRYSTIAGIVAVWEANLGPGEGWETEFTAALNNASDAQLAKIQSPTSYDTVRAILLGGSVPEGLDGVSGTEALGDLNQDLVYSPVFPCRIFDTRNIGGVGLGTPPVNDQTNDYHVYGDGATMTAQGGNPACCSVPTGKGEPVGISVNMAAIPVSPAGHLRVFPFQGTLPTASFLNYFSAGNVANSGLITTCYLCPGTGQDISVFNRNSSHSFADVMGYFYPAIINDSRIAALESTVLSMQSSIQNLESQSEGLGGGDFSGRTYCFFNVGRELVGENPGSGIYISHSTLVLNFTSSTQVSITDGGDVDAMLETDTGVISTGDTTPGGTTTIDSYSVTGNILTITGAGADFFISPDGNLLVGNQANIEGTDPNSVHNSNFRIAVRGDSC